MVCVYPRGGPVEEWTQRMGADVHLGRRAVGLGVLLALTLGAGCATESGSGDEGQPRARRGMHGPPMGARSTPTAMWGRYDLNGEGKVSRAEFMAVRGVCFARYDATGDGLLTRAAIQRRFPANQAARIDAEFRRIDLDGNDLVSREEWDREGDRLFRQVDANHDGVLAGNELPNLGPGTLGIFCSDGFGATRTGAGRPPR